MANDTRRKLFNALNQAGFDIGSYDDFDRRMNNQADRKKFYDAVSNAGYDIGDYDAFNKRITPSKYSLKIKGVNTPVSEKEYKDYVGRHGVGASAEPTRTEQKGAAVVQQQTRPVAAAKQQPTQPVGRPMTAQERSRMMASAGAIVNGSQGIVSQFDQRQKNREEYRRQQPLGQRVAKTKRLNQETGRLEDTYLTSQGSETNSQYAGEKEQRAINEAYREPSVDEQLQEALAMRDKLNKEMGENDVEWVDQEGRVHYKGAGGDEHMRSLEAAYRQNEERIRTLTYEKNDAGFWEHTGRELGDIASWNPYNAASDATALLRTKQKIDRGEKLDAEDNLLLANTLLNQEAHAQYDKNRDAWFRAGETAAGSIRLLPDFAIGMGLMKGIATGVARGTGKVVTKAIGKEVANKVAGKILTKAAGVAAGSLAAGAVMANTVQAPRLASETMKNMTGDLTVDKDGHFQFEGGENFLNSALKSEQKLISEAASEVTGEFLPGVGTFLEKVGLKKIAGGLARLQGTKWYRGYSKALEKVGFHGAPGEMLEEYAGDVYSAVLGDLSGIVGDPNSRKTDNVLFGHGGGWGDLDKHIDIALGTVTLGALLHAPSYINTGYHGAQYLRYRHQTNMADKAGRNMMGSTAWDGIKASLDNSTNESISDALSQVYRDWNLTNDGRKAALDYAMSLQRQRGHLLAVMADNKEEKDEPGRAADVISNSYASGYEADSKEEKEAITQNVQLSDDNLSRFGEGFANWVKDESNPPMATLSYMMSHRDVYSDEQIAAAADYYQTKAAADGMTQAAADRAELEGNQEPSPSYTTLDNMGGQFTVSTFDKEGSLLGQRVFSTEEEANAYRGEVRMQKEHAELQDYYGRALVDPQLTEQVAAFEEEQGWEAGTVQRLAESDPMKLSETELQMADMARSFLQGIAYPANEVHTEQSKQSGVDAAENSDIDTDHPNAEVVSSIVAPYIEARDRLNQLFAQNETLAEEVQTYEQMGRSEQEVISSLDSFRPEDVQTVIDFYNAQARFEGFMNRTQEKIEERVKNERGRRTFKGNINNRQDTVDLIELTDGENRYTLVNGDIETDAEGRVISADGIIIALDENGDFVKLGANSSLQILPQETTLDMWEQAYREQVQTNASAVIDADGTLNPAGGGGGDGIAGEETGQGGAAVEPQPTEPAATGSQQTEPVDEGGVEAPVSSPATVESVADKDGVKRYEKGIDVDAAIDDIQADGFDVNEVADASIDEAQETIDKINAKERKTRKDLMERKAAQDTIDYYQRLKERHAERQNGGGEAAVVQEQTEPVDGGEMPPSGEVPEWRYDTPEGARGRGYKVIEGHRVDRQEEKPMPAGKEVEVQYSTKDKVKGRLTVSELGEVQGSHLTNGQRNERHFLPEAQPKDEFGADRQTAAQTNASEANFRPELMLTFNDTQSAYSGSASQTNRRGEVIQGNGRRNLAEYIYAPGNEAVAERYKQYLMAHAEELGTTAEDIAKMEKPFAHIVLDVTDEEAIRLGQFTAQDLESGGKKVPEVSSTVTKLGNRYGSFANIVLNHEDPDASLAERIDANAEAAIKWLNQGGFINNTEAKTLLEDKALGRQFLKDMITDTLFKGASPNLRTMFFELPKNIQSAIVSVIGREVGLDPDMSILKNIQESILAYHELMNSSEQFAKAQGSNFEKRYAAVTAAVNDWLRQINMDGTVNSEKFSNFALELAKRYRSLKDQKSLAGDLRSYYDKATGATRELGMFDDNSQEPTNKKELIKQIFGIDYDARQRAVPLAGDHRGSEEGREGSSDRTEGDERKPEGTGAADDRGGDTGDAGGVIPQSREEYLSSHPLTEAQIMADTEATEDEKLNAIDFLRGEDDSAISRFYYDSIYERVTAETRHTGQPMQGEERDSWQSATDEEFYPVAKEWLDQQEKPYSSALQRKFKIGYKKATRIMERYMSEKEAGEQIRKANTPTEAIEQAASSFREGQKKEEKAPEKEREEQKTKDQQDIDDALKEFEDFLDGAKGSSVLDKFMRKGLEGNDKAQASLLDAFTLTNEAQRMFLKDLLRLASKVGYAYIKSGVHDAQAWSKKMADGVGRKLREVLGWDDAVVGEFVDEVWQQKYTVDGVRMRLSEHAERLKNGKGADTAVNVNKTENNETEKGVTLQQEASEKPKTKDGWLKKMNEVFSKLCEKYGVPDDPIIFNQWGGRYNFDYRITKGYRLDQFEPYYEAYKKKLDEEVEPATDKQLAFIDRLAGEDEKEMLHSIKLNKVSASYVISILKAAEDAISNRMSTADVFEEYANELEKVAKLHGWKPAPKLEGDSVEFAERQDKIDTLRADIRRELKGLVMNGGKPHPMSFYKELSEKAGVGNLSATDLQELIEAEVVEYARELASEKDKTDKQKYDQIVMLYQMQPSLNARDNDRINKQQYSTPAPMAFLMGLFVKPAMESQGNRRDGDVRGLEPSAGNGMLTIGLPKEVMHVNDIDEMRLSNLAKQGFGEVTSQDGTQPFEQKAYDVVVTNPPFGSVPPKTYDGLYEISGLEHQMAINALESMKDDGRAAIIIGGNTEYNQNGTIKGKDRAFLNYLYAHYNVVDVINMDGKTLYSRQGTGFPVRMILINGRREFNPKNFAPVESKARAERVNSYDELFKRVSDDILSDNNKSAGVHNTESGESNGKHDNGHAGTATEAGVRTVRSGRGSEQHQLLDTSGQHVSGSTERTDGGTDTRTDTSVGGRSDVVHGAGSTTSQPSGGTATPAEQGGNVPNRRDNAERPDGRVDVAVGAGQRGSGASQQGDGAAIESQQEKTGQERASAEPQPTGREAATRTLHTERDEKERKVEVKRGLGTEKVPYRKQSGNPFTLQSLMPAEQADVVKKALEDLGDVDQFLVDELGYSSKEELHQALAAEQIDSVAMAIHQMNQGNAFIIGDQTGIGKGRQAAALIRYGVKKGGFPVFITVKKGLFSDMYRDLCDIGSPGLRPFIWSADDAEHSADVTDKDGNVVYKRPSDKEQKRVVDYINKYGKLPPEYDYIITTYDSFKGGTMVYEEGQKKARSFGKKQPTTGAHNSQAKRDALERLAENSYVIMDESHNAGGETSAVSGYLQYITTRAKGVTFLSATFAKRPGNMPIYSLKTAIAKAGVKVGELIDAVKRGGATFQEIMSKALTEAGQMIRRERDMSGVTIDWKGIEDEAVIEKQRQQYDTIIGLFNDIIDFQRRYVDPIVNRRNDEAAEIQGEVDHTPGTRDMGINNTPFASRTYNMVQQVLLSLKAEETAKRAIEHIKMGHKPVIALANTNEGAADEVSTGEDMEMPDLSVNLKKGLQGTLRITTKDAFGNTTAEMIPFDELSEAGQARYREIMDAIENASSGLSLSPIDVIKNELQKAGYKVGELTGRKQEFVYNDDGTVKRVKRQDSDKKRTAADFNNGKLDALILNKSAGTGISLHASSKFGDQRQRVMIVAQAQGDVNDEVQIRGRIDRTGQVLRGMYEYVVSQIPSEQRLLMMLKAKLRSLDANTTSSQKSKFNEMQVQDIINKYGDDIVIQYLAEHPNLAVKMVDPLKWKQKFGDGWDSMAPETLASGIGIEKGEAGSVASKVLGRMALLKVAEQEKMLQEVGDLYQSELDRLNEMGENDLEITEMPLRAKTLKKDVWEEGVEPGGNNPFADNSYVEEVEMDVLRKPMKADEVKKAQARLLGTAAEPQSTEQPTWEDYKRGVLERLDKWEAEKKKEATETITARAEKKAQVEKEKYAKGAKKAQEKNGMTDAEIERNSEMQYEHFYEEEMKKLQATLDAIGKQKQAFVEALDTFSTEGVYALPTEIYDLGQLTFEPSFGKVIDIKISDNFSTTASTISFATLDGRRKITIPISGMVKQNNGEKRNIFPIIMSQTAQTRSGFFGSNIANTLKVLQQNIDNWDKLTSTATRKKGYIITGNLLKALTSLQNQHQGGKLISYTTDTGEIRQGILMGDRFNPGSLTSKNPISSKKDELKYPRDKVESADKEVTVKVSNQWDWRESGYNTLELIVPKSKKKGEKYFNDETLLGLMDGQFEGSTKLKAEFKRENLEAVLKRLDELGVTVESQKEETTEEPSNSERRYDEDIDETDATIAQLAEKYNTADGTVIHLNQISDKDLVSIMLEGLGVDMDSLNAAEIAEGAQQLREEFKNNEGFYNPITRKIIIFAEQISKKWGAAKVFFHENLHAILHKWYGEESRRIADDFWNATPEELNGRSKDFIRRNYQEKGESAEHEEWFVYNLTDALLEGNFDTMEKYLPESTSKERIDNILKELGYDRRTEEPARRKENAKRGDSGITKGGDVRPDRRQTDRTSARQEGSRERIQPNRTEVNGHRQRIADHIDKLLDRLGTKGKTTVYHSFDELPEEDKQHILERERQGRKVRGWYENGHIYLYLPHIDSIYQAEKTIWHETVAHHGLRELVGAENYDKLLRRLWLEHRDGDMGKWVTERMQRNGWKLNEAIDEYLAREAEKEPFKDPTLWQRLRWMVAEVLHKMGFMSDPTLTDIKYLFWVSQNRLRENDPMSIIKQQAFLHRLDRAGRAAVVQRQTEPYVNMNAEREEDIYNPDAEGAYPAGRRYDEDIDEPLEYSEKAVYHERLDRVATMFTEAYQDAMVSLKTAQNAIAKDKEIPDSQNAYQAENLSHGKIKNETDLFNSQLRDPLIATINKIMNATGMTWGDVDRYVYTKSGLERNREFFVRDWLKKERRKNISHYEQLNDAEKAIFDRKEEKIEELFEDGSIATEEEKNKALKRALQETHDEYIDSVEDGWQREKEEWDTPYFPGYLYRLDAYIRNYIDDGYSPEKHDYSGFRAMYGDEDGKYNEDDIIGELMNTEGAIEEALAEPTERLWDQIRACTRYGLERYRQAGMRSDEQIDDIEKMFHWYVPMRGFAEDRGEDMYQYFTSKGSAKSYVGGLLKHAKGRGSEASYPISTIFAMTYKAISDCNQNIVNQYLYRLCQAHKNDLIVLSDSWVVLNEETDEWEEAWPEIPEDADDEEVRQITLEFEERMKALAQQGAARKLNGKPRFDYKPADRRKKDEHVVEVRINGQQKRMTVVGNPRLAQALNGQLRFERGKNFLSKWNAAIKNFMSALFTSYSPTFALRNMFRDWTHFRTMLSVREGEGYAKKANKYYRQSLPRMVSLFKKYRAGKLDMNNEMERDFKDFMDNGGITGFVQMRKIEDIQKEQEKMLKQMKNNKAVRLNDSMWKAILGAVETFNEAIENNARFATFRASRHYAGRTRARSAYDAKEITVNFNKKGAGGKTAGFKSRDSKVTLAAESFGLTSQILGEGRIFFNATVQAICTTFKNFQNADGSLNKGYIAKWVGRYAMPPFMLGLALPLINKALEGVFGGDDDDDKYANLPEWVRRRNLCFYIGHNNFITIPVGQELAAFLSLGDIAAGMTYADDLKPVDKSFADEMLDVLNTFSPVDVGTKITKGGITKDPIADITGRTFSVLAPWVAVGQNLSWMGRPIYKEDRYKGDEYKPEYQMVFSSTNPVMVGASKLIHELSGGDEVQRGKIEVNPAIVQYLWEQYAGGPGKVFSNTISIGKDAKDLFTEGESPDFNIRKVEGLKAFVQQGDDRTAYYRVNAKYRKYEEDGERLKRDLTRYAELAKDDPSAKMKLENLRKGKDFTRAQMLFGENGMAKELRKMYKAVQNAPDSKTEKELRLRYNKAMKQAVEMLDEVGE